MSTPQPFIIFEMSDDDWCVARSHMEAVKTYLADWGDSCLYVRCSRELTEAELDALIYWDTEDRDPQDFAHWRCECGAKADATCRWNGSAYEHWHGYPLGHCAMKNIHCRTFREELARRVAAGLNAPEMFATTEL